MENDLISRSAVKQYFCECCNRLHPEDPCEPGECRTMEAFDEQPAVDAVEVVRCKDCKYAGKHEAIFFPGHIICSLRMKPAPVKPDDFCSYGKRRNDV